MGSEFQAARAAWPPTTLETVYDYGFFVYPDEASPRMRGNRAAVQVFQAINVRVILEFTERQFNAFREELARVGLALREVERVPHLTPISVD